MLQFYRCYYVAVILQLVISIVFSEHWAVIVVGSNGIWNYRHQADGCHAYQILRSHGIPESNIVLMMYDDVANHKDNPFPGKLFNKPTPKGVPGYDVYEGCKIDYRDKDVTPKKFLQVLLGDERAGGKVLKSTEKDRVFINFVDHGAPGLVAFPSATLYARDLINTLRQMHEKRMYKELVFYMEACESGSMFANRLPENISIYATTAANTHESSWGTYCPPYHDRVEGLSLNTCLGDLYSVNWMEDSEKNDMSVETLLQQFTKVQNETKKSHVLSFGNNSIAGDPVGDFQATFDLMKKNTLRQNSVVTSKADSDTAFSSVDSRDIALVSKFYRYLRAPTGKRAAFTESLIQEIKHREKADAIFKAILSTVTSGRNIELKDALPSNFECHENVNAVVEKECGRYTDYSLKYVQLVVNMCESTAFTTAEIINAVMTTCKADGATVFNSEITSLI